jgi:NAD(P)-dependent dehydrogenase (short-subunit alcohol dehydrogenase family)
MSKVEARNLPPVTDLSGRGVLLIGATSGIGRACALAYGARGARVCIAGLGRDEGQAVLAETQRAGAADAAFMEVDVRHEQSIRAVIELATSRFGRLDIAVNNAGVETPLGPIHEATNEQFDQVMSVNVRGMWLSLKHEIRSMLANGGGSIVNTASTSGVTGIAGIALYTASKHAVVGLTKAAALELAQSKIRVNAVAPGPVRTGFLLRMLDGKIPVDQVTGLVPMARIAEPAEIAESIVWLSSDAASYVTGHTLIIDGGLTAA